MRGDVWRGVLLLQFIRGKQAGARLRFRVRNVLPVTLDVHGAFRRRAWFSLGFAGPRTSGFCRRRRFRTIGGFHAQGQFAFPGAPVGSGEKLVHRPPGNLQSLFLFKPFGDLLPGQFRALPCPGFQGLQVTPQRALPGRRAILEFGRGDPPAGFLPGFFRAPGHDGQAGVFTQGFRSIDPGVGQETAQTVKQKRSPGNFWEQILETVPTLAPGRFRATRRDLSAPNTLRKTVPKIAGLNGRISGRVCGRRLKRGGQGDYGSSKE
jgi:hypothetical protein